ncbi:hypothetical protein CLAFUW4_02589 [Fulvia fulva]|uniref:Heterokaryon incompatibility domain-containing protein n=1 Tax=Passalora fulva TaxID=5499 RepID=A0A9Q8L9R3_PASFU|nr:uncharacterized protein CLAFUR5_02578 [Fulvia fulva]KAK4631957.1 hypothetical protein CLAFUR4_02584 [Fulvia fulva]KAK4632488.1 hypothetical protein CLAFUR0_02586 [Fulvia fulva]UJO13414.1 hypothetical protein CLAFUR5_02578 [Fulvia fulva]WPV11363.1 hypothetical protein CLAFUW4_02589 [Fulvia fulva]WPV25424.1 hypothetical protein CLAFUW7_02589 [Fulvia fulva]
MTSKLYADCRLLDPNTHIRLLQFQDGPSDMVACAMSVHALADSPVFNGISYTWGESECTAHIVVNNHRLSVTPNCQYALWQARLNSAASYVWIDSVCIDQASLNEKEPQVALMGTTFSHACRVLANVGPHDAVSLRIQKLCDELRSYLRLETDLPYILAVEWHPFGRDRVSRFKGWAKGKTAGELKSAALDLCTFEQRRYWSRLWVVQELCAVGKERIDVLCGRSVLEWAILGDLEALFSIITESEESRHTWHGSDSLKVPLLIEEAIMVARTDRNADEPSDAPFSIMGSKSPRLLKARDRREVITLRQLSFWIATYVEIVQDSGRGAENIEPDVHDGRNAYEDDTIVDRDF